MRSVGGFALRDTQRETVSTVRRALAAHGGALLADAPGSGKTVLALAVASAYPSVLVIAPAAVRAQWLASAERAGVAVRVTTFEALSRGLATTGAALIVVDEAHHVRNPATSRYRALATLSANAHILLLTATPVVNSSRDCDALLALALGARAAVLDEDTRATVIVRRADPPATAQHLQTLAPLTHAADIPEIGESLRTLPPPLPVADGAAALALVRITLAMAWSSSLAALDASLRRRLQRGAVIADELEAGRWPSRDALRAWIVGDEGMQLAFAFASAADAVPPAEAAQVLARHLEAVRALRSIVSPRVSADSAARARALRVLLARESPRRIAVLAHHADTVRALYRALRLEPGVVAIIGSRVLTAAGRWTREEVLAALGARAVPWRANDPRGIRLLLATDILAEGVELQGISTLVHGDLAWTPARLEQRVGRVARDGQREIVHVAQFNAPSGARSLLKLSERLTSKRLARTHALKPAARAEPLRRALSAWRTNATPLVNAPLVAAVTAARCGFLALVARGDQQELIGGAFSNGRWRVGRSPRSLARLVDDGNGPAHALHNSHLATVQRELTRWAESREADRAIRDTSALSEALHASARRRIERALSTVPLSARVRHASASSSALLRFAQRGIGNAYVLQTLLRDSSSDQDFVERLTAHAEPSGSVPSRAQRFRVLALLVLVKSSPSAAAPTSPALPSACSETAATR